MARISLFASYQGRRADKKPQGVSSLPAVTVATTFVEKIVSFASQTADDEAWEHYSLMYPLLQEFSRFLQHQQQWSEYSAIIARPHRARLGDDLLSMLVYLKCNEHL
jgi:hypothetical protein